MTNSSDAHGTPHTLWVLAVLLLVVIRLPTLVQPAGGDQMLYAYVGDRIVHGDVPYRDAWDRKPPAVNGIYALLWLVWPDQSVVPMADLAAAIVLAMLLIGLGTRAWGPNVGYAAACLFLLLGDPYLQRLSGVWVRGQCETFIAVAVAAALFRATDIRSRGDLIFTGLLLGLACWLKYNAVAYALPIAAAVYWRPGGNGTSTQPLAELGLVAGGAAIVSAVFVSVLVATGAFGDWWLATITYNLTYSGETYGGLLAVPWYLITMPVRMAGIDMLWYLGGAGCIGLLLATARDRWAWIVLAWVVAGLGSIALNGARGLPQYFMQMAPILALAAAGGLAPLVRGARLVPVASLTLLVVVGLWRVGTEPGPAGFKLAGLPGAWSNLADDARHALDWTSRSDYLARFERTGDKYVPRSAGEVATYVRETTPADQSILVFGFTASIYLDADRRAASRFFWSRPVVVGFEASRSDYGASGLLADLRADPPSVVILQRRWGAGDPDPIDFFLREPSLRSWLEQGYVPDRDLAEYQIWKRKTPEGL